jgi:hypothetical protein
MKRGTIHCEILVEESVKRLKIEAEKVMNSICSSLLTKSEEVKCLRLMLNEVKVAYRNFNDHVLKVCSVNVGGQVVSITKDLISLLSCSSRFLFVLVSGQYDHLIQKDKNGKLFLDLDSHWVTPLFDSFRDAAMWDFSSGKALPSPKVHPLFIDGFNMVSDIFSASDDLLNGAVTHSSFSTESSILCEKIPTAESTLLQMLGESADKSLDAKLLYRGAEMDLKPLTFTPSAMVTRTPLWSLRTQRTVSLEDMLTLPCHQSVLQAQ